MGFWSGIGNIVSGKPVFNDEAPKDNTSELKQEIYQDNDVHKTSFVDQHGNKIVPEVVFRRFKSSSSGPKVTAWAWVKNTSVFEIEVVRVEALGNHQEIRRRLRPNEEHEVKVYDGKVITNDHDHHARLYYRIHENDDLFLADYTIEFNRESDGTFTLEEFHPDHTRDV